MKKPIHINLAFAFSLVASGFLFAQSAPAAPIVNSGSGDGVKDDLFDQSQASVVLSSTPLLACCGGAPAENALGGFGGVEGAHTLFADGAAAESVDYIDFQTATPLELTSYIATLADDSDDPSNLGNPNRGSTSFTLYSSPDPSFSSLSVISTTLLTPSYLLNYGTNSIIISDSFPQVTAQFFRIEVTRATAGGPRIREVDGFGVAVPEPSSAALLLAGCASLVQRRRRA